MSVKLQIIVQEPGWAMVKFTTPPDDDRERKQFLKLTLQDWVRDHQGFTVEKVQPIRFGNKLLGLNVFYCEKSAAAKPPSNLTVKVDTDLQKKYGKEYIEAVMSDVATFTATGRLRDNAVALINRLEIVVIMDQQAEQASILPLSKFRKQIGPTIAHELNEWLAGSESGFFCVAIQSRKK